MSEADESGLRNQPPELDMRKYVPRGLPFLNVPFVSLNVPLSVFVLAAFVAPIGARATAPATSDRPSSPAVVRRLTKRFMRAPPSEGCW